MHTRQQKYEASVSGSACKLAWQQWKARGDFYHKYSLLQILRAFGMYICTVLLDSAAKRETDLTE